MSAGTPRMVVRIPPVLAAQIHVTIARRNTWSRRPPWTLTDFLRSAITEKIEKMRRSRAPRR